MNDKHPVQWIDEQRLLPENVRDLLFSEPAALCHETD
jgi:hypothetical protein